MSVYIDAHVGRVCMFINKQTQTRMANICIHKQTGGLINPFAAGTTRHFVVANLNLLNALLCTKDASEFLEIIE